MGRNKISILLYIIVGLAVIGLVSSLINNPGKFLLSILIGIAVAFVIYMIFTRIINNRSPDTNDEMKKYRKAAKLSNQKYTKHDEAGKKKLIRQNSSPLKSRKRRRHVPHLTVIEGRKNVDKDNDDDRASN